MDDLSGLATSRSARWLSAGVVVLAGITACGQVADQVAAPPTSSTSPTRPVAPTTTAAATELNRTDVHVWTCEDAGLSGLTVFADQCS